MLSKTKRCDFFFWIKVTFRRQSWFLNKLTLRKFVNIFKTSFHFILRSSKLSSFPVIVKIDISPLCNLKCLICVHADPTSNRELIKQSFHHDHKMSLEQYKRIINEIKGRSCAVSLYHLGDPFIHPDLIEMCKIAKEANLNVHLSTNFSFNFSDDTIEKIARCGITHLTVCVDGISKETYSKTRINGNIDLVISNLRRLCNFKKQNSLTSNIEIQYIKFQHNLHELQAAIKLFNDMGIFDIYHFWGDLHNYSDTEPGKYNVFGAIKSKLFPLCPWPYFFTAIKSNGDVIPCCFYRIASQYVTDDPSPVIGNVFKESVSKVWNSKNYQIIRKIVSKPNILEKNLNRKYIFCDGCKFLFKTDYEKVCKRADKYKFEDIYIKDENGIIKRKYF